MLRFKAFLLLSLLSIMLFISPVVSARQLTPTTDEKVAKTAEQPNRLDGYDDQGGYEYGNSGYYGHEGYGGYEHKGYGHEGYGHVGYGHEGYGHEGYGGYGYGGYGHEGYGSYEHDGDSHEGYGGGYLASNEKMRVRAPLNAGYGSQPHRHRFGAHDGYVQPREKEAGLEETKN